MYELFVLILPANHLPSYPIRARLQDIAWMTKKNIYIILFFFFDTYAINCISVFH